MNTIATVRKCCETCSHGPSNCQSAACNFAQKEVGDFAGWSPVPITLSGLVAVSHKMAREKGWWDDARSVGECIALICSEACEALEEARTPGNNLTVDVLREDGKPEGFPSEMADIVIRVADLCGHLGVDLQEAVRRKMAFNATRARKHGRVF